MSIRRLIVEVDLDGLNVTEFCAQHGVSTWFFYDLRRRWRQDGEAALEPKSRAPKRVWNKTPADVEDLVVTTRKDLQDKGLDYGPDEVAAGVAEVMTKAPSSSTVYRILKARGFITPEPRKAPKRSRRRFVAARANESWQLDDYAWHLADGADVDIFNVIDDHSRLLVASTAMDSCTGAKALDSLAEGAATLGWPERFQSDNARMFRHVLADALRPLGVDAAHSRPSHPQTNGKVERFHQTEQKWLAAHDPARTIAELQELLDMFRQHYNHHRRHRGIDRRIPAQVWTHAPKAGPAAGALQAPSSIYRTKVIKGVAFLPAYRISVGSAHNGKVALVVITGLACHVFTDGQLARQLTLDPTRRNQTLKNGPGRPTVRDVPRQP